MAFFHSDPQVDLLGSRLIETVGSEFPALGPDQLALTWIVYDPPVPVNTGGALSPDELWRCKVRGFSYRGRAQIYPASVIKLFYLVAVHEWLEQGMIQTSPELERAVRDMIVDSSNDATSLVVDILTGTTSGPELSPGPFASWKAQRNLVNRYYQRLHWPELEGINVKQKTWCDGAYGRERVFLGETLNNRNRLTTEATGRLLHSIVGGIAVSAQRSQTMMALMKRSLDPEVLAADPENQVTGFLGGGLPREAQLWSKAGLMSQVRHDAAYVELPNQRPYLLVVFTEGQAQSRNETILPFIAQQVVKAIEELD